jgi:hypothetical protein
MANKQALRDLQSRLAERLQAARTEPLAQSWLAVECSSRRASRLAMDQEVLLAARVNPGP